MLSHIPVHTVPKKSSFHLSCMHHPHRTPAHLSCLQCAHRGLFFHFIFCTPPITGCSPTACTVPRKSFPLPSALSTKIIFPHLPVCSFPAYSCFPHFLSSLSLERAIFPTVNRKVSLSLPACSVARKGCFFPSLPELFPTKSRFLITSVLYLSWLYSPYKRLFPTEQQNLQSAFPPLSCSYFT